MLCVVVAVVVVGNRSKWVYILVWVLEWQLSWSLVEETRVGKRETTKYDNDPPARAEPLITGSSSSSSSNLKVPRVHPEIKKKGWKERNERNERDQKEKSLSSFSSLFPFPLLPCCLLFSCLKPGRSVAPGAFHSFLSLFLSFYSFLCSKQTAFFCRCRRRRRETKTRLRSGNI